MSKSLAVAVPNNLQKSHQRKIDGLRNLQRLSEKQIADYMEAKVLAARALAMGYKVAEVAKAYCERLTPISELKGQRDRERYAATKLRSWLRKDQDFRDLIYSEAVVSLDLKMPLIFNGVAKAAQRGRVDAARLALEVTGRHTSHEAPVTNVQVVLQNIPRPGDNP